MTVPTQIVQAQREAAAGLVQRARLFDQNAIGMIDSIRKNAEAGNERAKSAFAALSEYIRANPAKADMGAEVKTALGRIKHGNNSDEVVLGSLGSLPALGEVDAIRVACILLARGAPLSRGRVTRMHAIYPSQAAKDIFEYGLDNSCSETDIAAFRAELSEALEGVLCAGYCVGVARNLQLAAHGKIAVSRLSRGVAWELGRLPDEWVDVQTTEEEEPEWYDHGALMTEDDILTFKTIDGREVRRRLW